MNNKAFRKNKSIQLLYDAVFLVILVIVDQMTKYLAVSRLKNQMPYVIWDGVFELHFLENRGAAFGMLQNRKVFFVFAAVVMATMIAYILIKVPSEKKYLPWHLFLMLIGAGGIGNMIDRLRFSYVIDFFYFKLIDFPIFNVADIYITVGTALLVVFLVFVWKEEDLHFLSLGRVNETVKESPKRDEE